MSFSTKRTNNVAAMAGSVARRAVVAGLSGALVLALAGCGSAQTTTGATAGEPAEVAEQADATATADDATDTTADAATESSYYETAANFTLDPSDLFSDRDLKGSYDTAGAVKVTLSDSGTKAATGVEVDGSTVTITDEGTYVLSGTLTDGRVVVDVDDAQKVQLVLNGASITSSTGTALYVKNADKVFLTLAKGSSNTVASTGASTEEDDHTLDGAVFASDDLTVNGTGTLEVSSEQGSGIVGKDEVTLTGGKLTVTAAEHAIQAKDSVAVADGTYTLTAGSDGIHVAHDTNGEKGFAYFAGGTFTITSGSDGIDASNDITIDGGSFTIDADDDGIHSEYDLVVNDGTIDVTKCYEGLEGARYEQNGGDIRIVASDDGVNAVGNPDGDTEGEDWDFGKQGQQVMGDNGGETQDGQTPDGQTTGGQTDGQTPSGQAGPQGTMPTDGQAPDGQQMPNGGMGGPRGMGGGPGGQGGEMPQPPEGGFQNMEGEPPAMHEGDGSQGAGDSSQGTGDSSQGTGDGQASPQGTMPNDGQAPQGNAGENQMPRGGMGPGGMGGMMDSDDTASLTINGGKLVVDASGDGLDSNGTLVVTGGETYVSGPTNDGNGALDYGTTATVTGGILLATGSSGMAETFGTDSTQGSMLVSVSGNAGDAVTLKDADGNVLARFEPTKAFTSAVATAPGVQAGSTYTLDVAGTATEVTLDSVSYRNVQSTMGGMMGNGGMGGHGGMGLRGNAGQGQPITQDTTAA